MLFAFAITYSDTLAKRNKILILSVTLPLNYNKVFVNEIYWIPDFSIDKREATETLDSFLSYWTTDYLLKCIWLMIGLQANWKY